MGSGFTVNVAYIGEGVSFVASKKSAVRMKYLAFWQAHPNYTALIHTLLGIGLGMLAQTWVEAGYINALGWSLVLIGVIGHLYPVVG